MMLVINIFILLINMSVMFGAYFIIKSKIESKLINKEVIEQIKNEINLLMINFNETTVTNVSLIEDKIKKLHTILNNAERKIHGLDKLNKSIDKTVENTQFDNHYKNITYSPQKIVNQSKIFTEKSNTDILKKIKDDENLLEDIKSKPLDEKVKILNGKGYDKEDIRKLLKLDSGEFELLINFKNIKLE